MQTVGILVFDDVEELDFTGPLEVFGMAAHFGADWRTLVIAERNDPVRCRHGLRVVPDCTLDQTPTLDLLIVPGGLGARTHAHRNPRLLRFVREQTGAIASVCTGALILAATGILNGLTATTHHSSFDLLQDYKEITVRNDARFVIDGRIATSAGVSAGIDLALGLVALRWGEAVAERVAANLEWNSTKWRTPVCRSINGGKFETIAVHAGAAVDPSTGSVAPPIHLSTTYEHGPAAEEIHGYLYIREGNPTQARLEQALAAIEGGEDALAFASGVAAGAALAQAMGPGSHIMFPDAMYVDFRNLARDFLPGWGMQATELDMRDPATVARAFQSNTRLLWLETPSNPLMKIVDIAALTNIAHERGALVVVDNTFATPVLQRPLELGADIVLHSTTKYFGGHSDVQGGALILKRKGELFSRLTYVRQVIGGVASPFNSWLVMRGLRSLACGMAWHSANGMALAEALSRCAAVSAVHYPGLPGHPGHNIARKQMTGFGGMLSFQVKGGREAALRVSSRVKLFTVATSLGGVESLIEHRASSEGHGSTAPEDLLRISAGLEHPDDLIADLRQALA